SSRCATATAVVPDSFGSSARPQDDPASSKVKSTWHGKLLKKKGIEAGGESGIRTLAAPLESASYRFHIAGVARNASVAVVPCTPLHAEPNSGQPGVSSLTVLSTMARLGHLALAIQSRHRYAARGRADSADRTLRGTPGAV